MELSWGLENERMVLVIGERGRHLYKNSWGGERTRSDLMGEELIGFGGDWGRKHN